MQMKKRIQATYTKLKIHRWIAWLLCAALMGGMISSALPALAVNGEREEGTLCEHHSEHTEECGYVEAVKGQPCAHIHDDQCGYVGGGSAAIECTHEHDEECGYVEAVEGQLCRFVCKICGESEEDLGEEIGQDVVVTADKLPALAIDGEKEEDTLCEHHPEHTEECGYMETVKGQPCTHEHDDQCGYEEDSETAECTHEHDEECGYVEAMEGQPCQFVCAICEELEEVTDEDSEQDVAVMADQPIAPRAVQTEGLIAEFKFDDGSNRLKNSANSGVTASLRSVTNGVPGLRGEIANSDLEDYFSGGSLYLQDNACLVLEETADFNNMTEITVEMRIRIDERGDTDNKGSGSGEDSHWLFYAAQPGNLDSAPDKSLGVVLTGEKNLRILRDNRSTDSIYNAVNYPVNAPWPDPTPYPNQWGQAAYPNGYDIQEWNTIRIIYKPSNMALYVNDTRIVDMGMGSKTSDYFGQGRELWFGHSAWPNDPNFKGYIDDIKIYNYANYKKSGGGYLDGYIDEQKYIMESVEPPNTTVHMFDYWITGQEDNDFDPALSIDGVRNGGINNGHLLLFAGWNACTNRNVNSAYYVGSWNGFDYKETVDGRDNHRSWEPFQGIVANILDKGYPRLAIEGLQNPDMFMIPSDRDPKDSDKWYENNVGGPEESLAYLFEPENGEFKKAYLNVTGLFRWDRENGDYYFKCADTFAELNREQDRRPKKSTGNNRITLYKRGTTYQDFFPFNDATDLFYIKLKDGKEDGLDKANGTHMLVQSSTDEPFNHYFGMTVETTFEQTTDGLIYLPGGGKEPMNFYFSGDDDVWIFIDDVLVADLGGLHNEIDVNINFATGEVDFTGYDTTTVDNLDGTYANGSGKIFDTTLKKRFEEAGKYDKSKWNPNNNEIFADGSKHTLKFFYLERGNAASRCTISFNLQHTENDAEEHTHKKRSSSENVPVEPIFEEFVTLDVSTEELPKKKEETKEVGVLASPNTGDSNMVGLWSTLLVLSAAGLAAIHRTRKRGSK